MTAPHGGRDGGDPGSRRDPDDPERVVIRDRRRIDPNTGEPRTVAEPAGEPVAAASDASGTPDVPAGSVDDLLSVEDPFLGAGGNDLAGTREVELEAQLAERTADVQRVQADFANYRRRMERDREVLAQVAVAGTLSSLLPVLDDIDRARTHGDLTGAFKAVADGIGAVLEKAGLESFGDPGDEFDPAIHEAVTHDTSSDVERPTTTMIMRRGYRIGDRLVRPAMVGVTDPE